MSTFTHHHSYKAIVPYPMPRYRQPDEALKMVPKHPPKPFPTTNTSDMIREIIPESTSRDLLVHLKYEWTSAKLKLLVLVNVNSQTAIYPKEKKHRRNKCSFTGCERNKQQYPSLHYFKFPVRKPDICTQWVINCANDRLRLDHKSLQSRVVCEKHFIDDAFTSTMKSRLKHNAIPTEVLVDGDPPATVKNMN
ncbi:hypothetical protein J6590_061907 [Homalodisca vitripennis]|nr:hypothetical protein J6590_061907 [Homalodisca vitripennis]